MSAVVERLADLRRRGRLPQGLLFIGPESEELKSAALTLAAQVVCEAGTANTPCGACSACRRVATSTHPDVWTVEAEKLEIKIEQVRQLQRWLNIGPHEAKDKIAIINQADFLNRSASNALLKTLEEPPPYAMILLLARAQENLLSTVLSRLQLFRFPTSEERETPRMDEFPWKNDLDMLLDGRVPPSPAFLFSITERIGKEKENLRLFFRLVEMKLRNEMCSVQSAETDCLRLRKLDRLFEMTLEMENDTLRHYGNISLCLDRLLLNVVTSLGPIAHNT